MGGQGAWNLLRKAPDMFAAAITMAPRIISEQAELDDLAALKDLPVWFFHATNDPINLVSGSKDRYNKLLEVGNTKLKYTELSDEEMIEFGAGANTHATNIVMANTEGVKEWLFAQSKEVKNDDNNSDNDGDNDGDNNDTINPPVDEDNNDNTVNKPSTENNNNSNNNNSNSNSSNTNTNNGKLPNTGSPISSMMVVIMGCVSMIFGRKILMK